MRNQSKAVYLDVALTSIFDFNYPALTPTTSWTIKGHYIQAKLLALTSL